MDLRMKAKARSRPGRGREQVIRRRKVRRIAKAGQGQRPGQDDEVQVKIRMADERGIVITGLRPPSRIPDLRPPSRPGSVSGSEWCQDGSQVQGQGPGQDGRRRTNEAAPWFEASSGLEASTGWALVSGQDEYRLTKASTGLEAEADQDQEQDGERTTKGASQQRASSWTWV